MEENKYLFPRKINKNSLFLGYTFAELGIISILSLITAVLTIVVSVKFIVLGVPALLCSFILRRVDNDSKNMFEIASIRTSFFITQKLYVSKIKEIGGGIYDRRDNKNKRDK